MNTFVILSWCKNQVEWNTSQNWWNDFGVQLQYYKPKFFQFNWIRVFNV